MSQIATQDAVAHERSWITEHGVSNLRSLATAVRRHPELSFIAVNSAARGPGGKTVRSGDWLIAYVHPAAVAGLWWVGVVDVGTTTIVTSPVATPSEVVVPLLERLGVREARFRVEESAGFERNPWDSPSDARADTRTVYFIRAAGPNLIKIGVAGDVRSRLKSLQTGSPVPLSLLAIIPAVGQSAEAELHARFAASRSHGEWFRSTPDLLAYIAENGVRP